MLERAARRTSNDEDEIWYFWIQLGNAIKRRRAVERKIAEAEAARRKARWQGVFSRSAFESSSRTWSDAHHTAEKISRLLPHGSALRQSAAKGNSKTTHTQG